MWIIWFEDPDRAPEVFTDEEAARLRFEQISCDWNATLLGEVERNFPFHTNTNTEKEEWL